MNPTATTTQKEKTMNDEQHHPHSMSRWPALLQCAAFEAAPWRENEYTRRGRAVHALVANMIWNQDTNTVPTAMPEEDKETARWFADWALAQNIKWGVERRVEIKSERYADMLGIHGTADLIGYDMGTRTIHVADFKTFSRADDAKDSFPQLMGYALAFATEHGEYDDDIGVEMTILHGGVKKAQTLRSTLLQCHEAARNVESAILAAETGVALHFVNPWCDYCRHNGQCPGCAALVKAAVVDTSSPLCIVGLSQDVLNANPAKAAQVMLVAKGVMDMAELAIKMCKAAADANGGVIEDPENGIKWGYADVRGKRSCRDTGELFNHLMTVYNVQAGDFIQLCKPPFAACRDFLKKHVVVGVGEMTLPQAEAALDPWFDRGEATRQFKRM